MASRADGTERDEFPDPAVAIDGRITALLEDARTKNRGFTLGLANDLKDGEKSVAVKFEPTLPPADSSVAGCCERRRNPAVAGWCASTPGTT